MITCFLLFCSYFVDIFHMSQTTKEFFKGISQIEIFSLSLSFKKNRCIIYIINESLTIFLFMQRFEVTVKNRCMLWPKLLFIRFYITCTYVHSIIEFYQNTGCYPGFSLYSRYWSHPHNISNTWGIFYFRKFCIFHSSRRALYVKFKFVYVFSNHRIRINKSIL